MHQQPVSFPYQGTNEQPNNGETATKFASMKHYFYLGCALMVMILVIQLGTISCLGSMIISTITLSLIGIAVALFSAYFDHSCGLAAISLVFIISGALAIIYAILRACGTVIMGENAANGCYTDRATLYTVLSVIDGLIAILTGAVGLHLYSNLRLNPGYSNGIIISPGIIPYAGNKMPSTMVNANHPGVNESAVKAGGKDQGSNTNRSVSQKSVAVRTNSLV